MGLRLGGAALNFCYFLKPSGQSAAKVLPNLISTGCNLWLFPPQVVAPAFGREHETVQPGLVSNPMEFDGIEIRLSCSQIPRNSMVFRFLSQFWMM